MMLLVEAALRSCLLTAMVWLALKALRVRNPHIEMDAWSGVVAASLMMPLLMRSAPVRVLPVPSGFYHVWNEAIASAGLPASTASDAAQMAGSLSWTTFLVPAYLLVTALLAVRLAAGLVQGLRLVRRAERIDAEWTGGRDVRVDAELSVPLTFGRAILLPAEILAWDEARRNAVLAHEGSHAERGDFYLLLLAALHRTLFWFNPAAWWLGSVLAELAEARSDAAALALIDDRLFYAEILVDLAARIRPSSAGVPMARHATVRRRVGRILADRTIPAQPTLKTIALMVLCLVSAASLAAGALPSDILVKRRMVEQARPRTAIALPAAALEKFTGYYRLAGSPDLPIKVTNDGNHLHGGAIGHPALDYLPESDHKFFAERLPWQGDFQIDAEGRVLSLTVHENGYELIAARLDDAAGRALEKKLADRIAANLPQPGSERVLRSHIVQLQRGEIDDRILADGLAAGIRAAMPKIRPDMVALGPITAMRFEGVGPDGMDVYLVTHAQGARRWWIRLTHEGRIESMWFTTP